MLKIHHYTVKVTLRGLFCFINNCAGKLFSLDELQMRYLKFFSLDVNHQGFFVWE
ncbi:hypothetical protein J2S10_000930 [Neobacillus ginsengisoli]|uniref:EF-hand domain-containing protein n=1 Tax=Neobacillus ginsengisoli TaxID=904295 RepID=A0ABT9XQJ5_9BACI|nr:hypothetical protein [Neobacillus ginsengisoli]